MARPHAADDFEIINHRLRELQAEHDTTVSGIAECDPATVTEIEQNRRWADFLALAGVRGDVDIRMFGDG